MAKEDKQLNIGDDVQARASGNGCPCGITDSGTSHRGQQPLMAQGMEVWGSRQPGHRSLNTHWQTGHQVPGAMLAPKGLKRKRLGPAAREVSRRLSSGKGGSQA